MANHNGDPTMQGSRELHLLIHREAALPDENVQAVTIPSEPIEMLLVAANRSMENNIDIDVDSEKMVPSTPLLEYSSRLEDFMDVVTTYKCKFCPFSCSWKSGLMSHFRSTHCEVTVGKSNSSRSSATNIEDSKGSDTNLNQETSPPLSSQENMETDPEIANQDNDDTTVNGTDERQIFLCGECVQGFMSLEECKRHMLRGHPLNKQPEEVVSAEKPKKSLIKKKPNKPDLIRKIPLSNSSNNHKKPSKRMTRPPRALEEDYVLNKRRRQLSEEPERNFRCSRLCGQKFQTEEKLDYHMQCHVPDDKHFVCPVCSETADNWRLLSMHLWKVHTVDADLYACSECTYRTHSPFKLETHRQIHGDVRAFICNTCEKSFKQLSQLRNHAVIHKDRKNMAEKRWYSEQKCDICQRKFSDTKCLRKHMQAVHSKLKPFTCPYCGHMSARKAMLDLHLRQHTGEKPFHCDQCDYRTGDHNSLRRHKMRHTGIKPYKCPHCQYACIQAISYKTHLKNKHPGMEGLYACALCSFRSVNKDNYLNHIGDHIRGAIPVATSVTPTPAPSTVEVEQKQSAHLIINVLPQKTAENDATSSSANRSQTFTIQIAGNSEDVMNAEHSALAMQPHDVVKAELSDEHSHGSCMLPATTNIIVDSEALNYMQLVPVTGSLIIDTSSTTTTTTTSEAGNTTAEATIIAAAATVGDAATSAAAKVRKGNTAAVTGSIAALPLVVKKTA